MLLVSYKFVHIIVCNFFGWEYFNASFSNKTKFLKPLLYVSYIYIIFVTLPLIGAIGYTLLVFDIGNDVFIVALDAICVILLILLLMIIDIIFISREITREENRKNFRPKVAEPVQHSDISRLDNETQRTERFGVLTKYFEQGKINHGTKLSGDILKALPALFMPQQ